MRFYNIALLALVCLTGFTLLQPSHAQNTIQDYLNTHNAARAQVGVSIPNMVWDNTVALYANNYVKTRLGDCSLVHSSGPYGENLAKGSSSSFTGVVAVNLWVAEKPYYNYTSNACIGTQQCKHYTQVVWSDSIKLGCARLQCNNGWWFVSCNYDYPGNYDGERPY